MDIYIFIGIALIVWFFVAIIIKVCSLENQFGQWRAHCLHHDKLFNDIDIHRVEDNARLGKALERIQDLEDRLEAHASELTAHHNRIDTLEINGSVYESLFEQQGLWGEETAEHSDGSEALEFPDPEDEEIII